jgi:F0F1-type ATP synthase epsilon subunit
MIPWQRPTDAETERIRRALERHKRERNSRDEQQQERAAERALERLWDGKE